MNKLKLLILDAIFPPYCLGCGKLGYFICPVCDKSIVRIKKQTCPKCNCLTQKGEYCKRCRGKTSLFGVVSFGYFKDPLLSKAIKHFKYHNLWSLENVLSNYLTEVSLPKKIDLITFVPQTNKKQAARGYNQSEKLAIGLSQNAGIKFKKLLVKKGSEISQVGLKRRDREQNLVGVFKFLGGDIKNKTILVVDDVCTTGSTLNECAKVLKKSGAKRIWGIVLAKES